MNTAESFSAAGLVIGTSIVSYFWGRFRGHEIAAAAPATEPMPKFVALPLEIKAVTTLLKPKRKRTTRKAKRA